MVLIRWPGSIRCEGLINNWSCIDMLKNLRGAFVADMTSLSICFAQKCHTLTYIGIREYVICGLERKNCRQFNHVHTRVTCLFMQMALDPRGRQFNIECVSPCLVNIIRDRSVERICIKHRFQSESQSEWNPISNMRDERVTILSEGV